MEVTIDQASPLAHWNKLRKELEWRLVEKNLKFCKEGSENTTAMSEC